MHQKGKIGNKCPILHRVFVYPTHQKKIIIRKIVHEMYVYIKMKFQTFVISKIHTHIQFYLPNKKNNTSNFWKLQKFPQLQKNKK